MENNFFDIIKNEKPVLVDFFATWCGPCKMLAPVLIQVKETLGDKIKIIKIDTDKNQELSSKYQVRGGSYIDFISKRKTIMAAIWIID